MSAEGESVLVVMHKVILRANWLTVSLSCSLDHPSNFLKGQLNVSKCLLPEDDRLLISITCTSWRVAENQEEFSLEQAVACEEERSVLLNSNVRHSSA